MSRIIYCNVIKPTTLAQPVSFLNKIRSLFNPCAENKTAHITGQKKTENPCGEKKTEKPADPCVDKKTEKPANPCGDKKTEKVADPCGDKKTEKPKDPCGDKKIEKTVSSSPEKKTALTSNLCADKTKDPCAEIRKEKKSVKTADPCAPDVPVNLKQTKITIKLTPMVNKSDKDGKVETKKALTDPKCGEGSSIANLVTEKSAKPCVQPWCSEPKTVSK